MNIKIDRKYFLSLLSAVSVLRKDSYFRKLLTLAKNEKISSEKIYEALLQTYLFAGFPSALISLKTFGKYFKPNIINDKYEIDDFKKRGIKNCKKVYGNKYNKLISNVHSFSPELSEWLIIEGYGKTIGRNALSMKERELCIVSILTVLKFKDQLISHINGALRCGNTFDDIKISLNNLKLIGENNKANWGLKILSKFNLK
jgi:alkylhydroperoxidase/carboxymuconolactone decarboxylase family protein YurZ